MIRLEARILRITAKMSTSESLRQLFDGHPYPNLPIEVTTKENLNFLYVHSLVTAHYLRGDGYIQTAGKTILDVGCGSGSGALTLAIANPGAKIVGVDLSAKSVETAKKRLQYHGYPDAEFYAIKAEEIGSLGMQFDYINCDETLYLLPDPLEGLKIMASVLSPQGIIRTNLHSFYGRAESYRAMELSEFLGLTIGEIGDQQCQALRETMTGLRDNVTTKLLWNKVSDSDEHIRMNFLLVGDKGSRIPEMFELVENSGLEWFSMVYPRAWMIEDLIKDASNLPEYLAMILENATYAEKLHLYELLHPINRLLDFWCGHPSEFNKQINQAINLTEINYQNPAEWESLKFHLHPVLRVEKLKLGLEEAIQKSIPFPITNFLNWLSTQPTNLYNPAPICLWLLWQRSHTISEMIAYLLSVQSVNPLTRKPITEAELFAQIYPALIQLETLMVILVENV